jgi:hypothetical protein
MTTDATMIVLAALLTLCIGALGTGLILLIRAQASVKDRELMCRTLGRFADRLVTEKDQQIDRMKMEAQVEIGADYMTAQREIELARARRRVPVVNGRAESEKADISIPMDEE